MDGPVSRGDSSVKSLVLPGQVEMTITITKITKMTKITSPSLVVPRSIVLRIVRLVSLTLPRPITTCVNHRTQLCTPY